MIKSLAEIKEEMEQELEELRLKRKAIIARFKKRLEEAKIEELKSSLKGN